MTIIGSFRRTAEGYTGRLSTLTLDVSLTLVPTGRGKSEKAPHYRIYLGEDGQGPEVGAGWKRSGERLGNYVSLLINDPVLTQPIRAKLVQGDERGETFHLFWNRPSRREAGEQRDAAAPTSND